MFFLAHKMHGNLVRMREGSVSPLACVLAGDAYVAGGTPAEPGWAWDPALAAVAAASYDASWYYMLCPLLSPTRR